MEDVSSEGILEQIVSEELQALNIPGAAIAVVYEDELVFAKGFGVANCETNAPLTPETLLRIGSLTKVITAYTLISLVQEQQLSVHAPINLYVPNLPEKLGRLTIHQLLSHTAGLKDDFSHYGPHDEAALEQAVLSYGDQHFLTEPGQIFSYSALGYAVAGVVIEALSKEAYAHVVQQRVLSPLHMERSTFYPTMAMTYPLSQGHESVGPQQWSVVRPYDDTAERWSSGFLFSNVIELSRFARAFINHGKINGKQVLSPAVIETLTQPYAKPLETPDFRHYGYGLFLGKQHGMRQFDHGGGRKGFSSHLLIIPEHRFATIQLLNCAEARMNKTLEKAMRLFLPLELPPPSLASLPEHPMTEKEIEIMIGRYARPDVHATAADAIQLVKHESKLMARLDSGSRFFPAIKIDENRFAIQFGPNTPPGIFAFRKGASAEEDYVCYFNRACKRISG